MAEKIEDGGPAFPLARQSPYDVDGMSLRDWFAGQALVEFSSLVTIAVPGTFDVVARHSYQLADAMLAARKAGA